MGDFDNLSMQEETDLTATCGATIKALDDAMKGVPQGSPPYNVLRDARDALLAVLAALAAAQIRNQQLPHMEAITPEELARRAAAEHERDKFVGKVFDPHAQEHTHGTWPGGGEPSYEIPKPTVD